MLPNQYNEIMSVLIDIRDKVTELSDAAKKELLTPVEVCRLLKIGRSTYQRYVEQGVIKQSRLSESGSKTYVMRSEIERLIDEGKL